LIFVDDQGLS
jgi:type III secretory pathway component EscU